MSHFKHKPPCNPYQWMSDYLQKELGLYHPVHSWKFTGKTNTFPCRFFFFFNLFFNWRIQEILAQRSYLIGSCFERHLRLINKYVLLSTLTFYTFMGKLDRYSLGGSSCSSFRNKIFKFQHDPDLKLEGGRGSAKPHECLISALSK